MSESGTTPTAEPSPAAPKGTEDKDYSAATTEVLLRWMADGDAEAADRFVQHYREQIKRIARFKLRNTPQQVQRVYDESDIVQSVMGVLWEQIRGEWKDKSESSIVKLLIRTAVNRVIEKVQKEAALKRGGGRIVGDGEAAIDLAAGRDRPPDEAAEVNEEATEILKQLSPDERAIGELRDQGLTWAEVAERLGTTADAVSRRWSRALEEIRSRRSAE